MTSQTFGSTISYNTASVALDTQASFAKVPRRAGMHKIAYMPPATEFNFYLDLWKGISAAASANGVDTFLLAPQKDNPAEQMDMLSSVLQMGVSAIIFATHDEDAAAPLLKLAVEKGIVVIIVNSDVVTYSTPVHAVIGNKQYSATYQLGQYALSLTQGRSINVGIIEGESGHHSNERVGGFEKAIQDSPLQIVARHNGHWNTQGGYRAALEMFRNDPNIGMVFEANDFEILGVEAALKTLGIKNVLLFGYDGVPATLTDVLNGTVAATVYANPLLMGKVALEVAMASIAGQFNGGFVEIPSELISASNASEYLTGPEQQLLPPDVKAVSIVSESIQGLTNTDGTGLYWDILRAIYEPQGITVNVKSAPLKRAQLMIKNKKSDIMLGHYRSNANDFIFPQWHYDSQNISAIFKKGALSWDGQSSLAGKRVAWIRGADYDKYLSVPVFVQEQNDHISPLIMLERGRIDFFLDDRDKILNSFQESAERLKMAGFDINDYQVETLLDLKLYAAFSETPRGHKLAEIFDNQIPELLSSGALEALFERWDVKTFPFK